MILQLTEYQETNCVSQSLRNVRSCADSTVSQTLAIAPSCTLPAPMPKSALSETFCITNRGGCRHRGSVNRRLESSVHGHDESDTTLLILEIRQQSVAYVFISQGHRICILTIPCNRVWDFSVRAARCRVLRLKLEYPIL